MSKQARIRAREARHAQTIAAERAARRTRLLLAAGGFVIAGLLVAIVAVVAASGAKDGTPTAGTTGTATAPAGATESGALVVGRADAPVTVEIYLDYMCPFCGRFERANSADIDRLVQAGKARVELHPLAFLDRMSDGTRYSTRAANAVATVADRAPAAVLAFNTALFADQPAEGSAGLADDRIAALAVQSGVPEEVASAFTTRAFEPWIAAATSSAFETGITGTPTVKINGTVFSDLYTAGALRQAVEAAVN